MERTIFIEKWGMRAGNRCIFPARMVRYAYAERTPQIETKREVTGMKRALLCVLLAALLLCGCTRAPASTVRAPDAGEPLTLCLGVHGKRCRRNICGQPLFRPDRLSRRR